MKERIANSVFWVVWSKGGVQVISLFSTLVVARLLSPADYGVIALAAAWIFPMSLVAEMGLGSAILQYRDLTDRELNLCFWLIMGLCLALYVVLFLLAPVIGSWFEAPQVVSVLRVSGLALPFMALRVIPDGLLRKGLQLDKVSQAELIASAIVVPTTLSLAVAGMGVWTLVAGLVLIPAIQSISTYMFYPWKPGMKLGSARATEILKYSLSTLGSKVCWAAYRQADLFILGKVAGEASLGSYSLAKQIATLPAEKISTAVNQIASPVMAHLQDDRNRMGDSLLRGIRLVACITVPIGTAIVLTSSDLVGVLLTDKWREAIPALQLLAVYGAIRSVEALFSPVLMARFRTASLFRYTAVLMFVMPIAFWIGAELDGVRGVALAWVLVYPCMMMIIARATVKEVGISWKRLQSNIMPVLIAAVAMGASMVLVQNELLGWDERFALPRLCTVLLVGCVAYSATLFLLDGQMYRDVKEIVAWAVAPRSFKRLQERAT